MVIQNNILRTIQRLYDTCSLEKNAWKREELIFQELANHPIFNHKIDTFPEKIFTLLYLQNKLKKEDLIEVQQRYLLLNNSFRVLLSKKIICQCFYSYFKELMSLLEMLVQYHCQERIVSLLSFKDFSCFSNLFEFKDFLFDTSSIPYDTLLGSSVYYHFFYQRLSDQNAFYLYDFMNKSSFEERDFMQQKWNQFGKSEYENDLLVLKKIFEELEDFYSTPLIQKFLLLNDNLLKKATKKRVRKSTSDSHYEYYESLV